MIYENLELLLFLFLFQIKTSQKVCFLKFYIQLLSVFYQNSFVSFHEQV